MGTWTIQEEVVLVYYITRNINYASIIEVMYVRCSTVRTINQINRKVSRLFKSGVLKKELPYLHRRNRNQRWNVKCADCWILHTMSKAELDNLLDLSGYIAAVIDEVSGLEKTLAEFDALTLPWQENDLGRFLSIMHIRDGEKSYWPRRFNQHYELRPYQSVYDLDHLYRRQYFSQHYGLHRLSPLPSPQLVDHLGQLDQLNQ
ncbi:hypothetical protein BDR22DRAFT_819214 [Usnea florida]